MRTKQKASQPLPPPARRNHGKQRKPFGTIPLPTHQAHVQGHRYIKSRHTSRKDSKTAQPPINSGRDLTVTRSASSTPTNRLCPLRGRDLDVGMSEDGSEDELEDRFSPLLEGDNGDGDSDYVPEPDSEDKQKTGLQPSAYAYVLRRTAQREADFLVSLVSEKSYNTRSKTRQAAKLG